MKLFSFDWFKSEKDKEMEALRIEEQKMKNEILKKNLEIKSAPQEKPVEPPKRVIKSAKLVNSVLTVVFHNGDVVSKTGATREDFENVRDAATEEMVLSFVLDHKAIEKKKEEEKEFRKAENLIKGVEMLKGMPDFEVDGNSVIMKGTGRTLPPLLVEKFANIVSRYNGAVGHIFEVTEDDEYIALKRFFLWCCLNPRAEVADSLYNFLVKNGMKITKQGFFVGLRNVVEVNGANTELVDFITNSYNKIKAIWKKKPSDYIVIENNGEYSFQRPNPGGNHNGNILGSLQDLYLNLPDMKENRFTDNWTKTFDIRIGKVVSMPSEECDWSTQDCARAGLHFAGHTAPYVLCGDTTVFTLHNPMKVVGIGTEKGRCWEYLPFMTTSVEEANKIMNSEDFDFLELDEEYAIKELEGLTDRVKEGFAVEAKKYKFNLPSLSSQQVNAIVASLEEMRDTLSKRVAVLD